MLSRLLAIIPALLVFVFANTFISIVTAGAVLIQLLVNPFGQHHPQLSLVISIIVALLVQAYLLWNHKLREYIKDKSKMEK